MATPFPLVVVQVGQCGNQLGQALFESVWREARSMPEAAREFALGRFFRNKTVSGDETVTQRVARAILVDTEPRVVREALRHGNQQTPVLGARSPVKAIGYLAPERAVTACSGDVTSKRAAAAKQRPPDTDKVAALLARADGVLVDAAALGRTAPRRALKSSAVATSSKPERKPSVPRQGTGKKANSSKSSLPIRSLVSDTPGRARNAPRSGRQLKTGTPTRNNHSGDMAASARSTRDIDRTSIPTVRHDDAAIATTGAAEPGHSAAELSWQYDAKRAVVRAGGAGNNWAIGYSRLAPRLLEQVLSQTKKELFLASKAPGSDASVPLGGIILLQSLAGGTGSGVGAAVCEALREALPSVPLLAVAVSSEGHGAGGGAVCVGHVNTALSLNKLLAAADAVVVASNDELAGTALSAHRTATPSIKQLNTILADRLAALLLPCTSMDRDSSPLSPPPPPPPPPATAASSSSSSATPSSEAHTGGPFEVLTRALQPTLRASPIVAALHGLGIAPLEGSEGEIPRARKLLNLLLTPTVREIEASLTSVTWRGSIRRTRAAMLAGACSDTDTRCREFASIPHRVDWTSIKPEALSSLASTSAISDRRSTIDAAADASQGSQSAQRMLKAWTSDIVVAHDSGVDSPCRAAYIVSRGASRQELGDQVVPLMRALEHPDVVKVVDRGGSEVRGFACQMRVSASPHPFGSLAASICVLYRHPGHSAAFARRLVRRSAGLLRAGAYLHHFEAYGVSVGHIEEALRNLWIVAEATE